jgi:Uma2 family endonuclease
MTIKEAVAPETKPARAKMSYEEFLQRAEDDAHAEWDAATEEVIVPMPPKNIHQTTLSFLYHLLSSFVGLFNLGKVMMAPFEVRLKPDGSSREPDIFFVANHNLARLTEERLNGPADLMIEIVSDDSVQRDRDKKFKEYGDAGVLEYWIIDPRPGKQRADFYRLSETGIYQLFATEDDERVESYILPDFWLRPAWLWQAGTLNPLSLFFEMRGLSAEQAQHIQQLLRSGQADKGTDDQD